MHLTAQSKVAQQTGSGGGSQAGSQVAAPPPRMRIVCMSATRCGQTATAHLLDAQVFVKAAEREVPLRPYLVRRGRKDAKGGVARRNSTTLPRC